MSHLLKGGLIATFDKDNNALAFEADVLIENTVIVKVAKNIHAEPGVNVVDCTGKWITPGFVDTHRHVWMAVLRGSQGDWLLSEYLVKNSWHVQGDLTPSEIRIGQLAGCLDALHNGVTTILDHFHVANTPIHAEEALDATIQSGARVVFCPSRQSVPTKVLPEFEWGLEHDSAQWQLTKFKEWGARDQGKLTPDGRVTLGFAYEFVTPHTIPQSQVVIGDARSWPVTMITAHVTQGRQILTWKEAGLLGPDVVFSHCNVLSHKTPASEEMWTALKDSESGVAATPLDELGMAHGNPVAFDAVERGVKVGLGVDTISINSGDMFTQMRFALQWWRGRAHEETLRSGVEPPKHNKFNSKDAFRLATLGGAEALNLSHLIGTIEEGKKADLLVFDANSPNLTACFDPFLGVVFHASDADIELVMVDGKIVKEKGKLVTHDWAIVGKKLRDAAEGIHKRWPSEKLEQLWTEFYDAKGTPKW